MVDPVTSATPAVVAPAAMTPPAMTELQLTEAIESTLAAAHLACQPSLIARSLAVALVGHRGGSGLGHAQCHFCRSAATGVLGKAGQVRNRFRRVLAVRQEVGEGRQTPQADSRHGYQAFDFDHSSGTQVPNRSLRAASRSFADCLARRRARHPCSASNCDRGKWHRGRPSRSRDAGRAGPALVRLAPSLVLHRLEPQGDSGHRKDRYTAPSDDGGPAPAHAVGDETAPPRVKLPEFFAIAQEALEFGDAVHSTAPRSVAVAAACCALCAATSRSRYCRTIFA